jgi:hypothetical protein
MFKLMLAKMAKFEILIPIQQSEVGDAVCCIIYPHEGAPHMTAQRIRFFLFVGLAALCLAQTALTNDSIIKLVKAGLGEDVVMTIIQAQPGNYSTGSDDLIALKVAGVSDKIIAAMIDKGSLPMPPVAPPAASNNGLDALPEKGPEPELLGVVYWLDRGNNRLNELERQQGQLAVKGTNPLNPTIIFKGPRGIQEIEGKRSPVGFASGSKPTFVFRANQNVDPRGQATIVTFTVKKKTRELTTLKMGGLFGSPTTRQESVPFQASHYNESSIVITPTTPLPPGEFGVSLHGSIFFCFGVD